MSSILWRATADYLKDQILVKSLSKFRVLTIFKKNTLLFFFCLVFLYFFYFTPYFIKYCPLTMKVNCLFCPHRITNEKNRRTLQFMIIIKFSISFVSIFFFSFLRWKYSKSKKKKCCRLTGRTFV